MSASKRVAAGAISPALGLWSRLRLCDTQYGTEARQLIYSTIVARQQPRVCASMPRGTTDGRQRNHRTGTGSNPTHLPSYAPLRSLARSEDER